MATETYELRVEGMVNTEYNECVLHFQSDNVTANDTEINSESLVQSWITSIKALWLAMMPANYWLDRLAARRVLLAPSYVAHRQFQPFTEIGTRATTAITNNLCPSVFLIPPMGVKSGGKVFLPGIGQADVINNQYVAGYLTAFEACFDAMIANFGVSGVHWQMAIVSRKLVQAHLVKDYQISSRLGFQGKRRSPV